MKERDGACRAFLLGTLLFAGCGGTPVPGAASITGLHFTTSSAFPENPQPTNVDVTLTDPGPSRVIYEATLALPNFPPGTYNCPSDPGYRHTIVFMDGQRAVVTATLNPGGCRDATISGAPPVRQTNDVYWALLARNLGVDESMLFSTVSPTDAGSDRIGDAAAASDGGGAVADAGSGLSDGSGDTGDGSLGSCGTDECCLFPAPLCPPTVPAQGAPCGQVSGDPCEYGNDPLFACNTFATCTAKGWSVQPPVTDAGVSCPTPQPACPATFASVAGASVGCPSDRTYECLYPEGACVCGDGTWSCDSLPNDCPGTRPRLGTPCATDGGGCQMWGESCADSLRCECGVWIHAFCLGG